MLIATPEAGHPPYIAARMKNPAYGMNGASRRWWNILDKALRRYGIVPTRADRCCYVLYSLQSRERAWGQRAIAQQNGTTYAFTESFQRSEMEAAFEKSLNPIAGSTATGKSVAGIISLFVDDLFGTGGSEMEQRVLTRLRQDFQVGTEDWNEVTFTGQRIRWTQDSQTGRTLKSVKIRPLMSWRRSQCNETRWTSIALPRCIQCIEAFWDR